MFPPVQISEQWLRNSAAVVRQIQGIYRDTASLEVFGDGAFVKVRWGFGGNVLELAAPGPHVHFYAEALRKELDRIEEPSGPRLEAKLVGILDSVVMDALAGKGEDARNAFQDLRKSHEGYMCETARLRQFILRVAATRQSREVLTASREMWACSRLDELSKVARAVLGLTNKEARDELCGPDRLPVVELDKDC